MQRPISLLRSTLILALFAALPLVHADDPEVPPPPTGVPEIDPPDLPPGGPPDIPDLLSDAFEGYVRTPERVEWESNNESVVLVFPLGGLNSPTFLRYSNDLVTWKNKSVSYRTQYENGTATGRTVQLDLDDLESLGARFFVVRSYTP